MQTKKFFIRGWLLAALLLLAAVFIAVVLRQPAPLPDFQSIEDAQARKRAFFSYLIPLVETENARIAREREKLLELAADLEDSSKPGWLQERQLQRLGQTYEVDSNDTETLLDTLLRRVDTVPVNLVLVQAAIESGWGRSRYASRGNNLFGQWCYESGCGFVPKRRAPGAFHEVARFDSPADSVASYMRNLNTHPAYAPLRKIRSGVRRRDERPSAMELADGLLLYSERRGEYVSEVKSMIRANRALIAELRSD
jgi:Bax protein